MNYEIEQLEALRKENEKLRGGVQALEAWQSVAAESNRNVSAYLKNRFPGWNTNFDDGMPVDNIRRVVEFFDFNINTISDRAWHTAKKISASEALYGFVGWLTSRDEPVTFSGCHSAAVAAELVDLFCEVNDMAEPRTGWHKNIVHPKECRPDESIAMGGVTEADRPPVPWRSLLEQILSKLSGDLNHDNVATAKQILKKMLKET